MTDASGKVTLTASYTPWGDLLSIEGEGGFNWGYFGGIMDTATGLLYLGNGQYYDPQTGRFLTRNARPDQGNPYVPWQGNPSGALISPLALLVLVCGRKRGNNGKYNRIITVVLIILVFCIIGLNLTGCELPKPPPPPEPTTPSEEESTPEPTSTTTKQSIATPEPPLKPSTEPAECATPPMDTDSPPVPGMKGHWYTFADIWTISHYVIALEWDPYFSTSGPYEKDEKGKDRMGIIRGLNPHKEYKLNWIYADRGVKFQGTGLSSDWEYITKDWDTTQKMMDGNTYFKYGKGGLYGPPRTWQTVATGSTRLQAHDWVKIIDSYPDRGPFEVLDIGEFVGESHLDIFIGEQFISTADSLGTQTSRVSVFIRD